MNQKPKLYKGEPVGLFQITEDMEVPTEALRVDITKQDVKIVHGFNQEVHASAPKELTVRFQTDQKLDRDESYWVQMPNRQIIIRLDQEPRQESEKFCYTVVVDLQVSDDHSSQ